MAASLLGSQLTEAHRQAQLGISKAALRDVIAVWPTLKAETLDSSFPSYARAMLAVLAHHKGKSASASASYLRAFREAEGVTTPFDLSYLDTLDRQQALTSLQVTGPIAAKVAVRAGKPADDALKVALVQTLGATIRLVQQGSRDTLTETIRRDTKAHGWARVTDGTPCAFCAMLASRGGVYSKDTVGFDAHDRCGCQPEPIYGDGYTLPGKAEEFANLWAETTAGLSGAEARNAFRRAYERGLT